MPYRAKGLLKMPGIGREVGLELKPQRVSRSFSFIERQKCGIVIVFWRCDLEP